MKFYKYDTMVHAKQTIFLEAEDLTAGNELLLLGKYQIQGTLWSGNTNNRRRLSTVDLLAPTR